MTLYTRFDRQNKSRRLQEARIEHSYLSLDAERVWFGTLECSSALRKFKAGKSFNVFNRTVVTSLPDWCIDRNCFDTLQNVTAGDQHIEPYHQQVIRQIRRSNKNKGNVTKLIVSAGIISVCQLIPIRWVCSKNSKSATTSQNVTNEKPTRKWKCIAVHHDAREGC